MDTSSSEAAFADEIVRAFAGAISSRHPRPKPDDCADLAALLAAVDRGINAPLPSGVSVKLGAPSPVDLLQEAAKQANAFLRTIEDLEKRRAIPPGWNITEAMKAAIGDYLAVVPPKNGAGRPSGAMWEEIVERLLPPVQQALISAGWERAAVTDAGPVAKVLSWALERVWQIQVPPETISRRLRERRTTKSARNGKRKATRS